MIPMFVISFISISGQIYLFLSVNFPRLSSPSILVRLTNISLFQFGFSTLRFLCIPIELIDLGYFCAMGTLIEICVSSRMSHLFSIYNTYIYRIQLPFNRSSSVSIMNWPHRIGICCRPKAREHSCFCCTQVNSRTASKCSTFCQWMPKPISWYVQFLGLKINEWT